MKQAGILSILVFSILLSPFSNGHAESTNKTISFPSMARSLKSSRSYWNKRNFPATAALQS
jgi:hypothetical protein